MNVIQWGLLLIVGAWVILWFIIYKTDMFDLDK
jgi:ABC-type uncharacterized transport system permease subunit